jgi:xylan 1,4-beta-xylosidase
MKRRSFVVGAGALACRLPQTGVSADTPAQGAQPMPIRLDGPFRDLPHFWETCVGSDHARIAMQADWREQMKLAHAQCGFQSVRFHGLFDDDMGVCVHNGAGGAEFAFLYIDQVLDYLLEIGVRPFVELGFMPTALASSDNTVFWYNGNTSPPRRMSDWTDLVGAFAQHVVARYGLAEVRSWRFEVWNEPNLSFWAADQAAYFAFYTATAHALKRVSGELRVGGPATAQFQWIPEFLAYCAQTDTPVDFVSGHIYPDDPQENVFGRPNAFPFEEVIPRAIQLKRQQIDATRFAGIPLVVSEWTSLNPAFIAQTTRDCAGLVDTMSYWTFNNVFEERGPIQSFDNTLYGLIRQGGVLSPAFHAFSVMHRLGRERIDSGSDPVLATRGSDGSITLLAWHLIRQPAWSTQSGNPAIMPSAAEAVQAQDLTLSVMLPMPENSARVTIISPSAGSADLAYRQMGQPASPTQAQLAVLRQASALPAAETLPVKDNLLTVTIPANGLAFIEIGAAR